MAYERIQNMERSVEEYHNQQAARKSSISTIRIVKPRREDVSLPRGACVTFVGGYNGG